MDDLVFFGGGEETLDASATGDDLLRVDVASDFRMTKNTIDHIEPSPFGF
jgi:hypothetical protein